MHILSILHNSSISHFYLLNYKKGNKNGLCGDRITDVEFCIYPAISPNPCYTTAPFSISFVSQRWLGSSFSFLVWFYGNGKNENVLPKALFVKYFVHDQSQLNIELELQLLQHLYLDYFPLQKSGLLLCLEQIHYSLSCELHFLLYLL